MGDATTSAAPGDANGAAGRTAADRVCADGASADRATLDAAVAHWAACDPILADLARRHPPQTMVLGDADPFTALAEAIVHQQVSLAAGRTIWKRVEQATGGTPAGFLGAGEDALRAAGLSRQKMGYLLDLAARVADGELDLAALADLDDAAAVQELTRVKGIGTWSAKMHLLFHLQRPDVCPWEDLGVRLAVARFYGVAEKDAAAWLKEQAARWSPYNSLAARVLWNARQEEPDADPHSAAPP